MVYRLLAIAALLVACLSAAPASAATAIAYAEAENTFGWCAGYPTAEAAGCSEEWCGKSGGTACDAVLVCDAGWNAISRASDGASGFGAACDSPSANFARVNALAKCIVETHAVCWLETTFDGTGIERSMEENRAFDLTWYAQGLLIGHGYDPGTADGAFGARTRAAVKKFQADMGLEETGEIDEDLFYLLLARIGGTAYLVTGMESVVSDFTAEEKALAFGAAPVPSPARTMSEELVTRSTLVQKVMFADFLKRNEVDCATPARSVEAIDVANGQWTVGCDGGGDYTITFAADDQSSTIVDNSIAAPPAVPEVETPPVETAPGPGKDKAGPVRTKTKG